MRKLLTLLGCVVMLGAHSQKGSDHWNLAQCIQYAKENNVSVKQADIQSRISILAVQQAKYNLYPNVSGNSGLGVRFGRSIDPTTNTFSTTQFLYQNFGANASVQLYNQGHLRQALFAARFSAQAALTDVEKASNDIAFTVATYYLQVLSAKEQITIARVQISQTLNQYDITKKKVDAGLLPELSMAEVEAQLASDSSNYITATSSYEVSIINMRAVLNLDPSVLFGLETPPVETIPLETFAELQPDRVFQLAMANQPLQKGNDLRIKAAQKNILASKALMYPTLLLGGNLSTNFSSSFKQITSGSFLGYTPITGSEPIIVLSNVPYYLQTPIYRLTQTNKNFGDLWQGYGTQISNNFGQNVGLSLSIPIFNNGIYKIGYQQSKLNLKLAELNKEQSDITLKQNIYTAYSNAVTALQKFNAGKKTVESAQKAYDFALKRFEVGLLNSLDLLTNQNNLLKAKEQQLSNQYDYVFKMKLLEFYKGQGLKL